MTTPAKKPRGRPKTTGDTKSESVLIRLEPKEKQGFTEAAELAGIPMTAWMRERLRVVARKELESAGRKAPFLPGAK